MVAVAPDRGQFAGRLAAPFRVARVPGHAGVPSLYVMLPRQRGLLFGDAFGVGVKAYPDRDSEFNPPVSQRDSLAKMEVRSAPNDAYVTTRAMASAADCAATCAATQATMFCGPWRERRKALYFKMFMLFPGRGNGGGNATDVQPISGVRLMA